MAKMLPILEPLAAIRQLYFRTTRQTIERDFEQALELLKAMPSEDERSRATVYMHGLAQMREQWGKGKRGKARHGRASSDHDGGAPPGKKPRRSQSS